MPRRSSAPQRARSRPRCQSVAAERAKRPHRRIAPQHGRARPAALAAHRRWRWPKPQPTPRPAPGCAHAGTPKTSSAVSGIFSASAAELQRHHRLGPRHRDVEAAVGGEQQRRRQRERQAAGSRAPCRPRRRPARARGRARGKTSSRRSRARDSARPARCAWCSCWPAPRQASGAEELAGDRAERQHHAHQADEDRDVGGASRPPARPGRGAERAPPSPCRRC